MRCCFLQAGNDDNVYLEALEKMLSSWTSLLVDADEHFARGQFKKQCTEIFNAYVQSHLTKQTKGEIQTVHLAKIGTCT